MYRARDRRLGREVALKVLPEEAAADESARARLDREAQTASTLNHPNICTIYEVGQGDGRLYIAMELVAGQTVSDLLAAGPLSIDRAIRYGLQIAEGLAHAHQHGIVHRDLKSANIIITADGRAKILDFGLAKRIDDGGGMTTTAASLTGAGAIVGTAAYMPPEVLRGADADARSDLWSLGIVLHEMASGRRPFTGSSVFELTSAIMMSAPPPLPTHVPPALAAIIEKLLAKSPGERYQQAVEVRAALEAVQATPSASRTGGFALPGRSLLKAAALLGVAGLVAAAAWAINARAPGHRGTASRAPLRAIAVLPLANLSGDVSQELFADGITEALITDLARVKGLDVISRTSAMQYKNTAKRLPDIARELGVDAVVQGSVIRAGDRVRISAQLIDAESDRHLWADEYDRELADVLVLQRDVARAVARQVRATLTPQEEAVLAGGMRVVPEAHDLFLRGKALIYRFNEADIAQAIRLLEGALRIQPDFVAAWTALAAAHGERGIWGRPPSSRETGARAREAITRALALDPEDAEAHANLGFISMVYDWDWVAAERALARGVELAAGRGEIRNYRTSLFQATRRFPEALAEAERNQRLDPGSVLAISNTARVLYRSGRFDDSIAVFKQAIAFDPTYAPNYARLADVYLALGRHDEALRWLDEGRKVAGGTRRQLDGYATVYASAGRHQEARALRTELMEASRTNDQTFYSLAMVDVALGDHDAAFGWLNRAYEARSANLWLVNAEIKFDPIRKDPRFADLLKRMGFK